VDRGGARVGGFDRWGVGVANYPRCTSGQEETGEYNTCTQRGTCKLSFDV
jgi:hypothetical protein